jgi:hypothetical protein
VVSASASANAHAHAVAAGAATRGFAAADQHAVYLRAGILRSDGATVSR